MSMMSENVESATANSSNGWSGSQVLYLIELVRAKSVLYDTKDINYKSRTVRQAAFKEIAGCLCGSRPNTTAEEAKKKWSALRQTYLAEKKKVEESITSGAGADSVYVPSLFYFDTMAFLSDSCEARLSTSNLTLEIDADSATAEYIVSSDGSLLSPVCEVVKENTPAKKRKRIYSKTFETRNEGVNDALAKASAALATLSSMEDDEDQRYAVTVADRLRSIKGVKKVILKKAIDDLLFNSFMEQVEEETETL